jgi:hypothetical protein
VRKPQGYAVTIEPDKADVEEDTFTCAHCNSIVFVKPCQDPSEMGGFCRLCYAHICGSCADQGECVPFEKKLEALESRFRFLRSIGLA